MHLQICVQTRYYLCVHKPFLHFEISVVWSWLAEVHGRVTDLLKASPSAFSPVTQPMWMAVQGLYRAGRWHAGGCQSIPEHLPAADKVCVFQVTWIAYKPENQETHVSENVFLPRALFFFYLGRNILWFPPILTLPYMKMDALCIILRSWLGWADQG